MTKSEAGRLGGKSRSDVKKRASSKSIAAARAALEYKRRYEREWAAAQDADKNFKQAVLEQGAVYEKLGE
jgi:hypothetical protein